MRGGEARGGEERVERRDERTEERRDKRRVEAEEEGPVSLRGSA